VKRIIVWGGHYHKYDYLCSQCRQRMEGGSCIVVEVPSPCLSVNVCHAYEVVGVMQYRWAGEVWRALGQALCGREVRFDRSPHDMLWLPRLFQYSQPEEHPAIEEALAMLALAGNGR
jgi:hypothetical protein